MSRIGRSLEMESTLVVVKVWGLGKITADGYRIYFWFDKNTLKLDCGDGYTT